VILLSGCISCSPGLIIFIDPYAGGCMALGDMFKVSRKTFFNPRAWLGYDELKTNSVTIFAILSTLFRAGPPGEQETFDQAKKRLNLSEKDIQNSIKNYRIFTLIFFIFALIAFCYAFYLLFMHGTFFGWLLGLCVCGLFLSQAFRFDFWALQMKKRTLGLTFKDWKNHILGVKEAS
jgi:intracellular multiplication protein IcmV